MSGMKRIETCNCCKQESDIDDMFVFNEKFFCMNCLYNLLMVLWEEDVISIDMTDSETCGMEIYAPI